LKAAKCGNIQCSSGNTVSTLDSFGRFSSIAIGVNGIPYIAYQSMIPSPLRLALAICSDVTCTTSTNSLLGFAGSGFFTSTTIAQDGLPMINHFEFGPGGPIVKVEKCENPSCSTFTTQLVSFSNGFGFNNYRTSIVIGDDGFPFVAHTGNDSFTLTPQLSVAKCGDFDCTSADVAFRNKIIDNGLNVGEFVSMAMAPEGFPIISYYDSGNGNLKTVKCANSHCISNWTRR